MAKWHFSEFSKNFMNIVLAFISVKYAHDLIHVGLLLLPIDLTAVCTEWIGLYIRMKNRPQSESMWTPMFVSHKNYVAMEASPTTAQLQLKGNRYGFALLTFVSYNGRLF
jgi:hypothetical protein